MNYLAHLFLSFGDPKIMVGNFIADSVKGRQLLTFQPEIQHGIILHRRIDTYTDQHPLTAQSRGRIRHRYRKYSGVIVDIYYDHFLAANWKDYSDQPLQLFTKNAYRVLFSHYLLMPARMKRILPAMAMGNWLASYASIDNLGLALSGIATRTRFDSQMQHATEELVMYYEDLKNDFRQFFPDIITYARHQVSAVEKELFLNRH
jgi:acyl carrier protein phosphodiesterase